VEAEGAVGEALNQVACAPASTTRMIVDNRGSLGDAGELSTDPAGGLRAPVTLDTLGTAYSIACPSVSLCVAGDSTGHILTATDPAGGPAAWSSTFVDGDPCTAVSPCSIEEILASSGHGVHQLNSLKAPGNGPFLTGLALTGDTLTWSHDRTPESAVLSPPNRIARRARS
jgi:hypothetical protein